MVFQINLDSDQHIYERNLPLDDCFKTSEQYDTWFIGSLMRTKKTQYDFIRLSNLHNHITHEETKFDGRLQANMRMASQLSEFFPFQWLLEITSVFRKIKSVKLGIKTYKDRICSYLGFIELYLTFRGLTLLDSTLAEINTSFAVDTTKNEIRTWKIKLLRIIPEVREKWIKIRAQAHQTVLFSTVVKIMNHELVLDGCSKEEIFQIKHECLRIAREFISTKKAHHIKKPEVWSRAICFKAVRDVLPDYSLFPFPHLPSNNQKVIDNKRWQLDKIVSYEK
ncbi:MAG: hypothetical protein ACXADY_24630 [Candidatus Hodarchaeales archaeon]|jgi:hypothetical protein